MTKVYTEARNYKAKANCQSYDPRGDQSARR